VREPAVICIPHIGGLIRLQVVGKSEVEVRVLRTGAEAHADHVRKRRVFHPW
jgi:hypothetical protein